MTDSQKAEHDSEYQSLLALFIALLSAPDKENRESALYALAELRTEYAFNYVLKGLGVDYDRAVLLIQNASDNNLTQSDIELRTRLVAALENLIDFSVCEEYQLYDEVFSLIDDEEVDVNSEEYDELLLLCQKYNDNYAAVENSDIEYAGIMAALWMRMSARDYLVYWTQNDSRVRPSHMALQGYVAPKEEFPSWMIPPIEYNCRCFLERLEVNMAATDMSKIKGAANKMAKPISLNEVYSESLATCGRIFGPAHSYFKVKDADVDMLGSFVKQLKEKYYGKEI